MPSDVIATAQSYAGSTRVSIIFAEFFEEDGWPGHSPLARMTSGRCSRANRSSAPSSASATAVRISATENGFVTTSCTMALRPEARSR